MTTHTPIPNTVRHQITAAQSGYDYLIDVKVPHSYHTSEQAYPVVYVLDGNWYFPMIASIVPTMSMFPQPDLPECIVVGVGYPSTDLPVQMALRARDFAPTRNDDLVASLRGMFPWAETDPTSGEAARFLAFMRDDLIPFVQSTYRADPALRLVHGHSLAGLFLLHALFTQPDIFHRYLIASPSIWWDDKAIMKTVERYFAQNDNLPASVVLSAGDGEVGILADAATLAADLTLRECAGLDLAFETMTGETHMSIVARTFTHGLRALLPPDGSTSGRDLVLR